ncbi:hypothetical protein caldi_01300 [Caldinitratiruptor microaerophilus]|uniref:Uncharacterized protein n=1 Tax=Caldinitratiruptor microaerophilus TaxID=671077 RepID=A0AA35CHG0_9FIRM|nr:hypothetical protein caldi_01300 [Caldinitratiruptor microaerophilus]
MPTIPEGGGKKRASRSFKRTSISQSTSRATGERTDMIRSRRRCFCLLVHSRPDRPCALVLPP